jgi:hypothetical protein
MRFRTRPGRLLALSSDIKPRTVSHLTRPFPCMFFFNETNVDDDTNDGKELTAWMVQPHPARRNSLPGNLQRRQGILAALAVTMVFILLFAVGDKRDDDENDVANNRILLLCGVFVCMLLYFFWIAKKGSGTQYTVREFSTI